MSVGLLHLAGNVPAIRIKRVVGLGLADLQPNRELAVDFLSKQQRTRVPDKYRLQNGGYDQASALIALEKSAPMPHTGRAMPKLQCNHLRPRSAGRRSLNPIG
jgi:hypothetical protein